MQSDPRNPLITPRSTGRLWQDREPAIMDRSAEFDHLKLHDPSIRHPTPVRQEPVARNRAVWVRASDLLARVSSRAAGTGIGWNVAAHRWTRRQVRRGLAAPGRATARTSQAITGRVSRLAPVSMFGAARSSPGSRSAVNR